MIPTIPAWVDDALCAEVGGELFYPTVGESPLPAIRICKACPVKVQCLAWALEMEVNEDGAPAIRNHRYGIYGGLNPSERARLAGGAA